MSRVAYEYCPGCGRDVPIAPGRFLTQREADGDATVVAHVGKSSDAPQVCWNGLVQKRSTAPGDNTRERLLADDRCWSEEFQTRQVRT